jgi:trk system potassium uptake protein TrkA
LAKQDPVVVIGLGRFGSALALELARTGTDVLAVDNDATIVQHLATELAQVVIADSTDPAALREIGVDSFERVVVAIGSSKEASILTTAALAELGIKHIWAKALDHQQATILRKVGAHHVVQPERDMGERVAHLVSGQMLDYVEVDREWVFATTRPPQDYVGVPLGQTGLRDKHKVTVVSVKPASSQTYTYAGTETVLAKEDVIIVAGHPSDVDRFVESG